MVLVSVLTVPPGSSIMAARMRSAIMGSESPCSIAISGETSTRSSSRR